MSDSEKLLYLSRETLESLDITTNEVIDSMEHLVRGQAESKVWSTPKSVIQPGDGRYMMSTLSAADDPPYLGVKSVVLNPANTERGLPQINGLIMLLDSTTGVPVAIVDGNWTTAIRTAGASALVARRLARPESSVVTFIGCGVQAQSHLQLFADMFPLEEVRALGRGQANRDALCQNARSRGYNAVDCDDPKSAVDGADIIVSSVTMTTAIDPFVDPHWLKPGVFLSSTDCAKPFMTAGMDVFDRIVIDDVAQEAAMPDPMVDPDLVTGDVTGLVNGDIDGRRGDDERCAFIFRAVALGDLALPALAYEKARTLSRGQQLD